MVITLKSPDSVNDAIEAHMQENPDADREAIEAKVEKYVEYVFIDIDLETGEAKVLPV